jgi:hypothetical protein
VKNKKRLFFLRSWLHFILSTLLFSLTACGVIINYYNMRDENVEVKVIGYHPGHRDKHNDIEDYYLIAQTKDSKPFRILVSETTRRHIPVGSTRVFPLSKVDINPTDITGPIYFFGTIALLFISLFYFFFFLLFYFSLHKEWDNVQKNSLGDSKIPSTLRLPLLGGFLFRH